MKEWIEKELHDFAVAIQTVPKFRDKRGVKWEYAYSELAKHLRSKCMQEYVKPVQLKMSLEDSNVIHWSKFFNQLTGHIK